MTSLALEPIYGSLHVALLVTIVIFSVIAIVTPPGVSVSHRRWLIMLRSLSAVVLLLAVYRPAMVRTDNRPADAVLVVAVDTSRSMTLPDVDNDRWMTQQQVWVELARGLTGVDDSLAVELITYDRQARVLPGATEDALDQQVPAGDLTDLESALSAAIQAAGGRPLAGVVLAGDGAQTAPIKGTGAQRIVETLNSMGVPLWCVPIGPAGGAAASRDAAIVALPDSYQLFAGNDVAVDFQLQTRGLAGVEIPVRLTWIDSEGKTIDAARRLVAANQATDVAALSVPLVVPSPGTYRLKVEAEKQNGELVTANNQQIAFVEVREGGGRILYLEGTPRLEQTFLRRALRRFPDLDMTYQWIPLDTATRWPIDLNDWFRAGKFDIYIIGDLDSAAIGNEQLQSLADRVAAGAGLIMLGGQQTFGTGGYATSPLADLIPVRMDRSLRRDALSDRPNGSDGQLPGPVEIRLTRSHPITDLGGDDPATPWQQLPPAPGANRFLKPKVAPGIQVLLESLNAEPLLVVGEYGKGRTAAFAIDSTWRWWRNGQSELHRRYWRQLILWLLSREDTGGDQIIIDIDSRRFAIASPSEFRASVQMLDTMAKSPELVAEVMDASEQVISVDVTTENRSDSSSAAIRGQIPENLKPGFYRLRVRPAANGSGLQPAELAFQTIDESRELARPMADPVYLRQLADLTADHGGKAFSPDEMSALLDVIAKRRKKAETPVIEKFRLGDDPLSGWILFGVFVGALSTEWFLRRRWGLA